MLDTNKNEESTKAPQSERSKVPAYAVWVATFVALSGTWHFGFSIGSVNAAHVPIVSFIKGEYEVSFIPL